MKTTLKILAILSLFLGISACNSDSVDEIKDAIDIADGVPRKDIDPNRVGVNCFFNDNRFGGISSQYNEVKETLKLRFIRVLMAWNDQVQPTPEAEPNFSFYDDIMSNVPPGVDILVILTDVPSWMANQANWTGGNPRTTFVEKWVKKAVDRYKERTSIVGWQIWNEPNQIGRTDNEVLSLSVNPTNYLELLASAQNACKDLAPSKAVINAATTAINPETLDYNRALRDGGIESLVDVYAIHYYGRQFENVVRSGGVRDFLKSMSKRIWVTESGAQGVNEQLKYVEQVWPFLDDQIGKIDRFYYYQAFDGGDPNITYGLRNLTAGKALSDLYIFLRDR
jgi:Glycosyl hydrolase catalytic core